MDAVKPEPLALGPSARLVEFVAVVEVRVLVGVGEGASHELSVRMSEAPSKAPK